MALESTPTAEAPQVNTQKAKKSHPIDSPIDKVEHKINNGTLAILSEDPKIRQASSERIAERLLQIDQSLPLPK